MEGVAERARRKQYAAWNRLTGLNEFILLERVTGLEPGALLTSAPARKRRRMKRHWRVFKRWVNIRADAVVSGAAARQKARPPARVFARRSDGSEAQMEAPTDFWDWHSFRRRRWVLRRQPRAEFIGDGVPHSDRREHF